MALLLLWKRHPTHLLGKVSKKRSCSVMAFPQLPGNQLKFNWKSSPRSSLSVYSGLWEAVDSCSSSSALQMIKWLFRRIFYQEFIWPEPVLEPAWLLPVCYFTGRDLSSAVEMLVRQEKVKGGAQKQNENSTRKFPFPQILRIFHQHLFSYFPWLPPSWTKKPNKILLPLGQLPVVLESLKNSLCSPL